jgi:hypothetical protein
LVEVQAQELAILRKECELRLKRNEKVVDDDPNQPGVGQQQQNDRNQEII